MANGREGLTGIGDPEQAWSPYQPNSDRPWTTRLAAHLLRRGAFGGTPSEIARSAAEGPQATVERLLDTGLADTFDQQMRPMARILSAGSDARALAAWWLLRMVQSPCPALEKITLFWHGHFATSGDKVQDLRALLAQNNLLRQHGLGNFNDLVQGMARDVAMLVYLDSTDNRKTRPNENFARELMELFCLGPGNYTEQDIKQLARCFTGWEVRRGKFRFNPYQHDEGRKSFLGHAGEFGGEQAVELVVQHPAASRFIARKLVRFYVCDERQLEDEWIEPVARTLRESGFQVQPAVRQILSSRWFFDESSIGAKIKSPVELSIGVLRYFEAATNMQQLAVKLEELGQLPLFPPSVKGWDGGREWINAATVLGRANLVQRLLGSGETRYQQDSLLGWYEHHQLSVDRLLEQLLPRPVTPDVRDVLGGLGGSRPSPEGLEKMLSALAALPEFQLN